MIVYLALYTDRLKYMFAVAMKWMCTMEAGWA